MNIMHHLTWRAMVKNRTRTMVTVLGIVLSAALFCAITTLGTSILGYLIDLQIAVHGDYHVSATTLTAEEAAAIRNRTDIRSLAESRTLGVVNFYGEELGRNSGLVKACNDRYFASMPMPKLLSGRWPQSGTELVIGEYLLHTMQAKGYPTELGSRITLTVTPAAQALGLGDPAAPTFSLTGTIVGIADMSSDSFSKTAKYSMIYTLLDEDTPAPLCCDLYLKAASPYRAEALAAATGAKPNYALLQYYGVAKGSDAMAVILGIMAVAAVIVMAGTVGLISNAFAVSVSQRTRQFGLLASVGATKRQLRGSVRFEGAVLCLLGVPAGLLVGYGTAALLLHASGDTVESMIAAQKAGVSLRAAVSPVAFAGAALLSIGAVFLSAALPAARAAKVSPIASIRQEEAYHADHKSGRTARRWWQPRRIGKTLAAKYYRVNRRKYRPIVAALGISVVLFLTAGAVSSSLQYVSDSVEMENCDFQVFFPWGDEALLQQVRDHESVAQSVLYQSDSFYAIIPEEYASQQRQDAFAGEGWEDLPVEDVWRSEAASVYYLEDDAFRAFLQAQGVDPTPYFDPERPLAAVLYQKWENVSLTGEGIYDWIPVTFPPFRDDVTELSILPTAPDVEEYTAGQLRAQGYSDAILQEKAFDTLPDGRVLFRVHAQGCSIQYTPGGVGQIVPEGEMQEFVFLAVPGVDEAGQSEIRYYPYAEGTDTVGAEAVARMPGGIDTIGIGAQLEGLPFGLPNEARSAMCLTLLRPLSLAGEAESLPALSIRTGNYSASKNYLEQLSEQNRLVYNDYLSTQYQLRQVSRLVRVFATGFTALLALICAANIFNIVSTNILLRRRDIGILRSLGMTNRGIAAMTVREYMGCGLRTLSWSLPVGLVLAVAVKLLLANVINGDTHLPWQSALVAILGVLLVTGSSLAYALTRLQKDDPIQSLRMENT